MSLVPSRSGEEILHTKLLAKIKSSIKKKKISIFRKAFPEPFAYGKGLLFLSITLPMHLSAAVLTPQTIVRHAIHTEFWSDPAGFPLPHDEKTTYHPVR
jgi:hypothetical protein